MKKVTVSLKRIHFFAFHGLFEHEKINGNDFWLTIKLTQLKADTKITELQQTTNYAELLDIAKQRMLIPTPLLETVIEDIKQDLTTKFTTWKKIAIKIAKNAPPLNQKIKESVVEIVWKNNQNSKS